MNASQMAVHLLQYGREHAFCSYQLADYQQTKFD